MHVHVAYSNPGMPRPAAAYGVAYHVLTCCIYFKFLTNCNIEYWDYYIIY